MNTFDTFNYEKFRNLEPAERGETVASIVSTFVNGTGTNCSAVKSFTKNVMNDHRTLQQATFNLFLQLIESWSLMEEQNRMDPRNEFTVKSAQKIKELLADTSMQAPLI